MKETQMKIEAKKRLTASDWKQDLGAIRSSKIRDFVMKLSSIVSVRHVNTEGYNIDDSAGCDVFFQGKSHGFGPDPVLSEKDLSAILRLIESCPRCDIHLAPNPDDMFTIVVASDAD
jgi:hypothetical protein